MNEPLTKEKETTAGYIKTHYTNPYCPLFTSSDILSAVELLRKKFDIPNPHGDRGPFFTREQVNEFIDSSFPVFKGEKENKVKP